VGGARIGMEVGCYHTMIKSTRRNGSPSRGKKRNCPRHDNSSLPRGEIDKSSPRHLFNLNRRNGEKFSANPSTGKRCADDIVSSMTFSLKRRL
jgi:hypothetical protein